MIRNTIVINTSFVICKSVEQRHIGVTLNVLELNDIGISVYTDEGVLIESPGYAIVDHNSLVFGTKAYHSARLHPAYTNTVFWDQLSLTPLPNPMSHIRHHADMAYLHLSSIWEQIKTKATELIITLPGSFDRQQLGLVLGIVQESAIPVVGMADSAVFSASEHRITGTRLLHLDMLLHRIVLTELNLGTKLSRTSVLQLQKSGLVVMKEAWSASIADAFVRLTRFDPLYRGDTEQQLYNQLPDWLDMLQTQEDISVEMQANGQTFSINLTRELLARAVAGIYQQITRLISDCVTAREPVALLLSHRFKNLPGFIESISATGNWEIVQLQPGAAARGALKHREVIYTPGESQTLVTAIPWQDIPVSIDAPDNDVVKALGNATHIVYRSRAYPINEIPLTVGSSINKGTRALTIIGKLNGISREHCAVYSRDSKVWLEDHSTYGTFLNGEKVHHRSATLQAGDVIRVGTPGEELRLIEVVNSHAT